MWTCDHMDEVFLLLCSTLCNVGTVLQHPLEFFVSRVIKSEMLDWMRAMLVSELLRLRLGRSDVLSSLMFYPLAVQWYVVKQHRWEFLPVFLVLVLLRFYEVLLAPGLDLYQFRHWHVLFLLFYWRSTIAASYMLVYLLLYRQILGGCLCVQVDDQGRWQSFNVPFQHNVLDRFLYLICANHVLVRFFRVQLLL